MKQFKRMQELLGTWHDFVVLADRRMLAVAESDCAHQDAVAAERAIDLAKARRPAVVAGARGVRETLAAAGREADRGGSARRSR